LSVFSWTYQFVLGGLVCVYSPKALYDYAVKGKYRKSLGQRFGKGIAEQKNPEKPLIWLHAASMGETKAIAKLAKQIQQNHPNYALLISSITETGHEESLRSIPTADYHIYLPLDFSPCIKPLLQKFRPELILLSETEVWWNFLRLAKEQGAKIGIVNGKVSDRSNSRLSLLPKIGQKLYSPVDLCCAQTMEYGARFQSLGVPRVLITGNTKFDIPSVSTSQLLPNGFDWIIIGSTHPGEEEALVPQILTLTKLFPKLRIAVVPRHPERFDTIERYLSTLECKIQRYSKGVSGDYQILLVDAMGILAQIYSQAKIAIVGGSFVPGIGGHNIVEPCLASTPVLFGPYMDGQKEMLALVKKMEAGKQLPSENIAKEIKMLLDAPEKLANIEKNCLKLAQENQGATERTYQAIKPWLNSHDR